MGRTCAVLVGEPLSLKGANELIARLEAIRLRWGRPPAPHLVTSGQPSDGAGGRHLDALRCARDPKKRPYLGSLTSRSPSTPTSPPPFSFRSCRALVADAQARAI